MKLSEAIRLGGMMIKPNPKTWMEEKDGVCAGCAIGAALYAVGVRYENIWHRPISAHLVHYWPWTDAAICDGMLLSRVTIAFNRDGFEGAAKLVEELEREFVPAQKEEVCER